MLSTAKEKTQLMEINMIKILNLYMHKNMDNLSSLTITIHIQNSLHVWEEFQHQLSVSTMPILEVCVQQVPSTGHHNP